MVRRAEVIRTCVGCRQRASATELLRIVASANSASTGFRLIPDPARILPGRGAHIHSTTECLASARRRRAFGRALRLPSGPDTSAVEEFVTGEAITANRHIDGEDEQSSLTKQGR